jgi:predicted metal-dependent hydrolase
MSHRMIRKPEQLLLPFQLPPPPRDERQSAEHRLRLSLEARLGESVHLTVTDNRHTIVSVRTRPDGVHAVRVHHMFLAAEPNVLKQLARYVERRDPRSSKELSRFIALHRHLLSGKPRKSRGVVVRTRGRHFDLQEIFDDLNARCFDRAIQARITWAPLRKARRRRSIKLGTYCVEDRVIRVNPILDQPFVPRYFLEWIVHHEMLHGLIGVPVIDGRRMFHPPEFREREQAFEHYERARAWEREHLDRLLQGAG